MRQKPVQTGCRPNSGTEGWASQKQREAWHPQTPDARRLLPQGQPAPCKAGTFGRFLSVLLRQDIAGH